MKKLFFLSYTLLVLCVGSVTGHFISTAMAVEGYSFRENCFKGLCARVNINDNNEIVIDILHPHKVKSAHGSGHHVTIKVKKD